MSKWDTPLGGSLQAATMYGSEYTLLDFLSKDARRSILWHVAEHVVDSIVGAEKIHPDQIGRFTNTVEDALRSHALGLILSVDWKRAFAQEFLAKVTEMRWNGIYNENRFFDERRAREAHAAEYDRKRREAEEAKARKVLGLA